MGGRKWLILGLLLTAGPAWGQSEDPHFERVVRPWMEKFIDCEKAQLPALAKTEMTPRAAADAAFAACGDQRRVLTNVYLRPPYSFSQADAEDIVSKLIDELRPLVEKQIDEMR
ncbi:hypothetical protein [Dongia sp. agr-C8]